MYRYRVVRDEGMKVWAIYDNETKQFLGLHFQDRARAAAKVKELVAVRRAADAVDAAADPATSEEASHSSTVATAQKNGEDERLDKRQRVVLDALAGKVKCSGCDKAYHGHSGSLAVGPNAAPVHSIKITRYIGFDSPKLMVDLDCVGCGHGGLYQFSGNPLMDAGLVPKDIPF